jgi:hypothetical protein
MFLWTEAPVNQVVDKASWTLFYRRMRTFVDSNCANVAVTKLILRVVHPYFAPGGYQAYWPPAQSPLYTELLSTLPSDIEVVFYPYIESSYEWGFWTSFTNITDPIEAVFAYSATWNTFLASQGSRVRVSGIVLDLEEIPGRPIPSAYNATLINAWKLQYGLKEYGVSVGYDQVTVVQKMASYTDSFYLQFYDFYYPTPGIDSTVDSPFLTYLNDAVQMVQYIINPRVLKGSLIQVYQTYQSKIYAMWSIQSLTNNCTYTLDGTCGLNHEFGAWSPASFNDFYQLIIQTSIFKNLNHGIFQFSFVPLNWLPKN